MVAAMTETYRLLISLITSVVIMVAIMDFWTISRLGPGGKPSIGLERGWEPHVRDINGGSIATGHMKIKIYIVYNAFINLKRSNWADLIELQVQNLVDNGLMAHTNEFHACLSIEPSGIAELEMKSITDGISEKIHLLVPAAIITLTFRNKFEYPGIHKVWEIGQRMELGSSEATNSIVLYFHSKGMFNGHLKKNPRSTRELLLFQNVIDPWKSVLERFNSDPDLNKAGFAASEYGYIWYNFWWTRVSYVQKLVEPPEASDRYYYERWLGHLKASHIWPKPIVGTRHGAGNDSRGIFQGSGDCLSLCRPEVPRGAFFTIPHPCEVPILVDFSSQLQRFGEILGF